MQRDVQWVRRCLSENVAKGVVCTVVGLCGCASPGPPHAPSLGLPHPVTDLTASRVGDAVELRFTVPTETSDGQPLRAKTVTGTLCRQMGPQAPCVPVDMEQTQTALQVPAAAGRAAGRLAGGPAVGPAGRGVNQTVWTDTLPAALRTGSPRLLLYRVAFANEAKRSAGFSDPVAAAAGAAPPMVSELRAEGTRQGVLLRWTPLRDAGEVLIERTDTTAAAEQVPVRAHTETARTTHPQAARRAQDAVNKPEHTGAEPRGTVWLQAAPGDAGAAATVDGTVTEAVLYRYRAVRRRIVQVGGHTMELRSASSPPAAARWRDVYPPAAPQGLAALGYAVPDPQGKGKNLEAEELYAVDLIWQPVDDTHLAGYLVYRQGLGGEGVSEAKVRLTPQPIPTPGFHDGTALPHQRYRYSVSAVDPEGNESNTVEAVVEPSP